MVQPFEVKRVEAQDLLSELKAFSFDQSPGFRNGTQSGLEVRKNFYFTDPVPRPVAHIISREMCKSSFGFTAFRAHHLRNKPAYTYIASASVERTLPAIPLRILSALDPDILEAYDNFDNVDEGALCEESSVELETSDFELREITTSQRYELSYAGDTIYEASDDDILFGNIGDFVVIPPLESEDFSEQQFVPEIITHESLDPADRIITGMGFLAIVEPLSVTEQIDSYRSAAVRMRAIMQALRTGIVE